MTNEAAIPCMEFLYFCHLTCILFGFQAYAVSSPRSLARLSNSSLDWEGGGELGGGVGGSVV